MPKGKTEPLEGGEPHDPAGVRRSHQDEKTAPPPIVTPVEEKIGEGRDDLRQRGEWFQRRTGR